MQDDIFILVKNKYLTRLNCKDILLIEADGHYSKFITTTGNHLVHATLTQLETELPQEIFCRVHRSYIVRLGQINYIEENMIDLYTRQIPIAKSYKKGFLSRLNVFR